MITLSLETVATIGTFLSVAVGLFVAIRAEIRHVNVRIDALDAKLTARIDRLDDRVYALAAGLRPKIEAARGDSAPST